MSVLEKRILSIITRSEIALHEREICCILNHKPYEYCQNVDGNGARCVYWYRRPKHELKTYTCRLVEPKSKYPATRVITAINELVRQGKLKKRIIHLRDNLSKWGRDNFRLIYIHDDQLRKRLKTQSLI